MVSIFHDRWINVIFYNRNQSYGAFELRKITERNLLIAMFISIFFLLLAIAAPDFIKSKPGAETGEKFKDTGDIVFIPPPPVNRPLPQKPAVQPSALLQNIIKHTIPVIVNDPAMTNDDGPQPQDAFVNANAGAVTQIADSDGGNFGAIEDAVGGNSDEPEGNTTPHIIVEQMPEFPGGDNAFKGYLHDNIKYPAPAIEMELEGTVYVQFVVEKDGSLGNVKVVKGPHKILEDEALRVVNAMPRWKPGKQNGKPVRVLYTVPVRFILN